MIPCITVSYNAKHLFDRSTYFRWLWMTNSLLLPHFNHMLLTDRVLFFSSKRKIMLTLIFFSPFPTLFFPTREFETMCHRLNYQSKFVPCTWFLGWGVSLFGQWDVSDVYKQRLHTHLQIQACIPLGCREMPGSATASSPGAPAWAGVGSPQPQAQLHSQTSPSPTTPCLWARRWNTFYKPFNFQVVCYT